MTVTRLALAAVFVGLAIWRYAPVGSGPSRDYVSPDAARPPIAAGPASARTEDVPVVSSENARLRDAELARVPRNTVATLESSTIAAPRPLDIIVNAPLQAVHGSEFEVSVGVGSVSNEQGAAFRSATFNVAYDVDSLEVLDIVDAEGTALATVVRGDGSVELEFDRRLGATRWPAVRFLARVDTAHITQITVTADVLDEQDHALATAPAAPVPIMLLP